MEADIAAKAIPDYNRRLPIFPVVDSVMAAGYQKELEEIIKKASYSIQKHPTSNWVDDSYLLIGKARYIALEFDDAIKTFKYINSTSKTEETRHEALLWLMRSFINIEDLESAKAVSDIMKKQFLNKDNAKLLFLTRAQLALLRQENNLAIENLKLAIPITEKKDEEARTRFILAQLYQEMGQDKLAYEQFNKVLKKTPPYELGFQSKLRLGQVTEIANAADKERIDKYFKKLRKDAKNLEYLDKIYYEMAQFELKQNKPDQALQYITQSVKASTKNPAQKGYSYLLAGQIYYDKLQRYRLAQQYYDSAVQVLPPTAAQYAAAAERRDVLTQFANQYTAIEREDSLQVLANLSPADLDKRIDEIIALTEKREADAAQQALAAANRNAANPAQTNAIRNTNLGGTANNTAGAATASANGLWYFDNPVTIGTARAEFVRRWGNRQLQDNWRITNQVASETPQQIAAANAGVQTNTAETQARQDALRMALLKDIPVTPQQRLASDKVIEDGLFALANIYRLQLKEPLRAAETYEKLLTRFPKSKYAPEAYYTLYLINKDANDPKQTTYANLVKQQFPNTRYAKLIDQPDYLAQLSAGNKVAQALYDSAFVLYDKQKFVDANTALNTIKQQYPDADLADKVAFLNVMIIAQTEQPSLFKLALQQFLKTYPASPLATKARTYLASFELFEQGKLSEAEFDRTHPQLVQVVNTSPKPEIETSQPATPAQTETKPVDKPIAKNNSPQAKTALNPTSKQNNAAPATGTGNPNNNSDTPASNATPPAVTAVPEPPKPTFNLNMQLPHVVIIAYPKGHAAFTGITDKVKSYNSKYNAADKLTIETATFNPTQELVLVREFTDGQKAKAYAIKQKSPQSPLSRIRGIEFVTFVVSSENLPNLLKAGSLDEYLTFYKNNY